MRKIFFILLSILSCNYLLGQTHVPSVVKLTSASDLGNMIIYRNPSQIPLRESGGLLQYSALDTNYVGTGNIRLYSSPFSSNYKVNYRSPAYNRGNNALLRAADSLDLDYQARIFCEQVDLGAFEYPVKAAKVIRSPIPIRACEGSKVSFSVEAEGDNLSYQWQRNGVNLLSRTYSEFTIPTVAVSDTAYYRVIVIGSCCQDTSEAVRLEVDPQPAVLAMNDTSIISGESLTLKYYSAIGSVSWYESDRRTRLTDTILNNIEEARKYFAIAKNGVCADSAVDEVNINIAGLPCVIKTKPDTTICLGDFYQLLIDPSSTVANYRWYTEQGEIPLSTAIFVQPQDTTRYVVEGISSLGQVCRDTQQINVRKSDFHVSEKIKAVCGTSKGYADIFLSSVPEADLWMRKGFPIGSGNRYFQQDNGTNEMYVASYFDSYCTKLDTILVYVNPPNIYALTRDTTLCFGDSLYLQTNLDPKFVSWELNGVPIGNNPYVFPTDSCVYRAVAYDSICGDVDAFIQVNVNQPPLLIAMNDTVLCQGSTLYLNSQPHASYWMTWEGLRMPDNQILVNDSTYYVALLREGVCTVLDTLYVYAPSKPNFRAMEDTTIIIGSSINLLSIPPATYWQDTLRGIISNGIDLRPDTTTIYKGVLETEYCGVIEDYIKVNLVLPKDSLLLSLDFELACQDGEAVIWAIVQGGAPPYTYLWNTGSTDSLIRNLPPGEYQLQVKDMAGSIAEAFVQIDSIKSMSLILQGINPKDADCQKGEIRSLVQNGFPPYLYYWSDGSVDSNLLSAGAGEYRLRIEDIRGCEAEQSILLECTPGFSLPNFYISPNGDGMNDYLKIPNIERYPINELIIISLYNKEVISFVNYDNTNVVWDGRDRSGKLVPSGTYYVVFKAVGIKVMTAWVYVNLGATK